DAGGPVTLRFPATGTGVEVTDPAGSRRALALADGAATLTDTRLPGLYRVTATTADGPVDGLMAVNFAAGADSDVRPADTVGVVGGAGALAGPSALRGRRELWWPLALAALAALAAEWLWYHRSTLRRSLARP